MPITGLPDTARGQGTIAYKSTRTLLIDLEYLDDDESDGLGLSVLQITDGVYDGFPDIYVHRIRQMADQIPPLQAALAERTLSVSTPLSYEEAKKAAMEQGLYIGAGMPLSVSPEDFSGFGAVPGIRRVAEILSPEQEELAKLRKQMAEQAERVAKLTAQLEGANATKAKTKVTAADGTEAPPRRRKRSAS